MPPDQTNLLLGTLDMLILKSLALTELHGLGISRRIEPNHQGHFRRQARLALSRAPSHGRARLARRKPGANPKTIAAPNTTNSPPPAAASSNSETKRWCRISLAIARALESN